MITQIICNLPVNVNLHKSQDHYANNCKIVLLPFCDRPEIFDNETAQASGDNGERNNKNGFSGVRADDDFWNLKIPGASFIYSKHPCKLKDNVLKYNDD